MKIEEKGKELAEFKSKDQVFWENMKEGLEMTIENFKNQIKFNKEAIKMCENKIKEFKK